MRTLVLATALLMTMGAACGAAKPAKPAPPPPPPAEETWIAFCLGPDAQYTQVLGGPGFFHVGNGDKTYQTQKLVPAFFDGNTVCGAADPKAPRATTGVALVCINRGAKAVSVLLTDDAAGKPLKPSSTAHYCKARIDVMK